MNKYEEIKKKHGEKAAKLWYYEKKKRERLEQLEKDYPMDQAVFDKGQTASMYGGAYITKKPPNTKKG